MSVGFRKKTSGGLASVDMPFISHVSGECTDGGRSARERPHLPQSEVHHKGSQAKEVHVLCVTLDYITSVCTC